MMALTIPARMFAISPYRFIIFSTMTTCAMTTAKVAAEKTIPDWLVLSPRFETKRGRDVSKKPVGKAIRNAINNSGPIGVAR